MATLTINGKQVTVSDDFLKLSPEQQNATVDEIAKSMGRSVGPPGQPGSREYADWAAQQARAGKALPQVSPTPPSWPPAGTEPMDQFMAGYTSAVNAVPIAGPTLLNAVEGSKAWLHGVPKEAIATQDRATEKANPGASTAGAVTGAVVPYLLAATIPGVKAAMGMGPITGAGSFAANTALSGGTSAAIGGLDSLARGNSPQEALKDAAISGGIGLVIPGLGAAVHGGAKLAGKGADWLSGGAFSTFGKMRNPASAGQTIVGKSVAADAAKGGSLPQALDQFAQANGQPIANIDRGGTITRNLARTASNVSLDAESALKAATDRASGAGGRVGDFLTRIIGGNANDVQFRQGLQNASRLANDPAYKAAFSSPAAQSIWSQDIGNMFQSKEFAAAVQNAENIGRTRAAGQGGQAVRNPFMFKDGKVFMKPGVTPTLEFWDKVKIGLDRQIEAALGKGEKSYAGDLTDLKKRLVGILDNAVPEYKQARAGAAMFFGAEDAMDAGRQFGARLGQIPEAEAAFSKFTAPEKKAFAVGWASSMLDKLGTRDGYGIVKQTFENPNARKMAQMALGPQKAAELESFLKVEAIMQSSSDAIRGNSSTARQLAMMGAVGIGTGGYGVATGDWRPLTVATLVTAGRAGMKYLGNSVDSKVMEEVARLLASNDKAALNKVVVNASLTPRWRKALQAVFLGIGAASHGAAVAVPQMAQ